MTARTWLVQNARFERGCWHIADDTRSQRVSPNPPGRDAWRAAWYTESLLLAGQPVMYHRDNPDGGRLSWQGAVARARAGSEFMDILAEAFPQAALANPDRSNSCRALPEAEAWLQRKLVRIRPQLQVEAGYEPPDSLSVCALDFGNPYSDQRQQRMWVRHWQGREDRVTLLHEYLHIAFRHHPHGHDETWTETLARRLEDTL